jgi:hypothetical protein
LLLIREVFTTERDRYPRTSKSSGCSGLDQGGQNPANRAILGLKLAHFCDRTRDGSSAVSELSGANHASRRPSNLRAQFTEKRCGCRHRGKIFSDGVIDLVSSRDACRPRLLFLGRETGKGRIADSPCGVWYRAPQLCPSIGRIMRLPGPPRPRRILWSRCSLTSRPCFKNIWRFLENWPQQVTLWMTSTWLADVVPSPPVLLISGPHMGRAVDLFQLVGCGSRRALSLTGINRAALVGLPMDLRPSLLINQPRLAPGDVPAAACV